jgi:small-conductance mechanosensitive channel
MDESALAPIAESGTLDISVGKVLLVLMLVGGAWAVANALRVLLDLLAERFPSQRLLLKRLQPIARIFIYAGTFYFVVGVVSPEEKALYAMLGSMALAIGLAAKDLLNDLIGGIVVLFDRSFQTGDRVAVGGHYGEVVSIGLRSTKLVTADDSLVTVPNSVMLASTVSNSNAGALDCQVVVDLYLPGAVDLAQVEHVAREAALTSKLAYLAKPVVVNVKDEFDETHLTHVIVKAYVFDARYENAFAADITRRVRRELDRRGLVPGDSRFGPAPSRVT